MKYLIISATIVAIGWFTYARVSASPQASRICEQIETRCGDLNRDEMSSCQSDIRDIKSMLGHNTVDQVDDCVDDSATCTQAIACMTREVGRNAESGLFRVPGSAGAGS